MASTSSETPSSSLSSSSSSIPGSDYNVFLSFRGEDTRHTFTDHLYKELKSKGIDAFRDSEKLRLGQVIGLGLIQAIEKSQYAIIVFSEKYADSKWCLDELVEIVECRKNRGLEVVPIFYHVDPSHVRKQTGPFEKVFKKHQENDTIDGEKIQKWKDAMREVGNLAGEHLIPHQSSEAKVIQNIVQWISNNLSYKIETNELVGISSRTEDLKLLLALESNDVRFIGIWGMGGMGKTTLAKFVHNKFSDQFEASSFIHDVRRKSENGLHGLQRTLLKKLLGVDMDIEDADEGVCIIKNRLHCKKILLILDDVDDLKQLEKLAGGHNWFGPGSRIVITTRNKSLLVTHDVKIYEVEALNNYEALQLFSLKAFGKGHPDVDYMKLSQDFVRYSHGLPLALELLGSSLLKKNKIFWKGLLDKLKKYPERDINKVLKISYEGLEPFEKEIFLNISCFFCGNDQDSIFKILDYLELVPEYGLEILKGKALIKLQGNRLWMHDLLQEMGRDIVCQECPNIPLRRSRLWLYKDIEDALEMNKETEEIQGIVLKLFNPKVAHWNLKSFSKMHCLKTLIIHNVDLKNDLKYLPNGLRFLDWSEYPSKLFPSSFRAKSFERLKAIKLNKSPKLIETPNFTNFPVLEELELKDCINLLALHPSIGVHEKLTLLNLKGCKNLESLPSTLEMESLEILILSKCSKVKSIPEFGENMKSVSKFYLDGTTITKLPTSIGNLTGLVLLNVKDCKNLMTLPSTFLNLNSLEKLYLSGCSKLLKILGATECLEGFDETETAKKLKNLFISGVKQRSTNPLDLSITSLSSLCSLSKLETLDLSDCNLNAIPNAIGYLSTLEILILRGNNFGSFMQRSPDPWEMLLTSPSEGLCSLNKLDLSYCNLNAIPNAIGCLSLGVKQRSTNPLDLSITSLSSLCSLSKLETLDLSYCNLNAIPNAIGYLSTLKILILRGNNFGSFMQRSPDPWEMLLTSLSEGSCSLNKLDLSYCNLNAIPNAIGCLSTLEILILSGNNFGDLMQNFTSFPVLKELELKDCRNLLALHPSIGVHEKLTLLNLEGCKNLKLLPSVFRMESLEILILSGCSKVKKIPEFEENMKSVSKFYLDGTAITTLPTSIGNLTGLLFLNVTDCKKLMAVPTTIFNIECLRKLDLSRCSKLTGMLGATDCLEGFDETANKLENLFISGAVPVSSSPLDFLISSLLSSCSLSRLETLDLSYCNLNAIPNAIGCLSTLEILNVRGNNSGFSDRIGCLPSLEELILNGNKFGYLPESIAQLSKLLSLELEDCLGLQSLPMLPLRLESSPSLDSFPRCPPFSGLGEDGYTVDNWWKEWPRLGLDQDFIVGIYKAGRKSAQKRLVLGSEIPESFELQNIGAEINIKVPSHLCDELAGIASCGVICCCQPVDIVQLDCYFMCNGKFFESSLISGLMLQDLSDRLFVAYFPGETINWKRYVVNGFAKFGIRYRAHGSGMEVKECGIHLVYEKELESFQEYRNRIRVEREKKAIEYMGLAEKTERRKNQREKDFDEIKVLMVESQRSNNNIILYEGSDDCDGAGPSGEGSSNDVPCPKRIERLPELAHGDSDSEGSSEYHECGEELHDWEESRESDQEG